MNGDDPISAIIPSPATVFRWKVLTGLYAIIFGTGLVVTTAFLGDPENDLTKQAMSGGFITIWAVLAAAGFGSLLSLIPLWRR